MIAFAGNNLLSVIRSAESVLCIFGAGMSVDSGIPDYRSSGGWYRENGPFTRIGKTAFMMFMRSELEADWNRAWGLLGFQQAVISRAKPHAGYALLAGEAVKNPCTFVLTSNVDELALRAGFPPERVHQCHGSIFRLQCSIPCCRETWPMPDEPLDIDVDNFLVKGPLPYCPFCGAVARPNVYFFGDSEESYVREGSQATAERFSSWIAERKTTELLMVEIGCGLGAPGLRHRAEQYLAEYPRSWLIRINDSAAMGPPERFIGIQARALHVLHTTEEEAALKRGEHDA
jgi:NAD-dependent SIR2 family protein deacetylase